MNQTQGRRTKAGQAALHYYALILENCGHSCFIKECLLIFKRNKLCLNSPRSPFELRSLIVSLILLLIVVLVAVLIWFVLRRRSKSQFI